ncbi:MAG: hypothetical protein JNK82_39590 [Myxococcaceae bacterium]|nr:hypothetical protein [Myxococcaceae bacterium]
MSLLVALLLAGCSTDADCSVTTWKCCGCPQQRAVSTAELKAEEDKCATKKCAVPECENTKFDASAVAVCKAGQCVLGKPPQPAAGKAECSVATDCDVWCCQEDLQASKKGTKPRKGCKRCPSPQPAAECLEGKCQVAPHALGK